MERQHLIFITVAAAAFALLILFAFYSPLQLLGGNNNDDNPDIVKVKKGDEVNIKYSSATVRRIQDLPDINRVEVQASSELEVTNLAGLKGEIRYSDMSVTFVRHGEVETASADAYESIGYRFLPDAGNKTAYSYDNVDFVARSEDSQLVVTVKPLTTAEVGEKYLVKLYLRTGTGVDFAIAEKTVEIIS